MINRLALALLLLATPVSAEECYIITSDKLSVFFHELAHCNDWWHPPFEAGWNPPSEFIHPYNGKLHITITSQGDPANIAAHAQRDADITVGLLTAPELCTYLWDRNYVSYKLDPDKLMSLVGCSLKLP